MPHTSFCLRDKGHFSKRNIRSLFLVLIPRTACHNAFTFCPYIRFFSAGAVLLRKGCKLFSSSVPGSQQWGCLWAGACVGRAFLAPLSPVPSRFLHKQPPNLRKPPAKAQWMGALRLPHTSPPASPAAWPASGQCQRPLFPAQICSGKLCEKAGSPIALVLGLWPLFCHLAELGEQSQWWQSPSCCDEPGAYKQWWSPLHGRRVSAPPFGVCVISGIWDTAVPCCVLACYSPSLQ